MTTAEKLNTVYDAFNGIKDAIVEKGGTAGNSITEYPQNILDLPSGGGGDDVIFKRCTEYKMPDGEFTVPYGFLYLNGFLTHVDCNNTTTINSYSFYSCNNLSSIEATNVNKVDNYSFLNCTKLISIDLPEVNTINTYSFNLSGLTSIIAPKLKSIGLLGLSYTNIASLILPELTSLGNSALTFCSELTYAEFPSATSIGTSAFSNCRKLKIINFGNTMTSVPTLSGTNAFVSVGVTSGASTLGSYHIVVPDALYDEWITKTNWSSHTNYIVDNTIKYSDALAQGIITE